MTENSLKHTTTKGIIWSAIDKFSVRGVEFLIGIILARLLTPSDFGLIGMLAIFIAISQTFIDSGMGSGLIQSQERTSEDYSTVFVFNLVVSSIFYLILFVTAPLIAKFYKTTELIDILRVIGLSLVIRSLSIVQYSRLTIAMDFKTLAKANIISVVLSGAIAIYFAYKGIGVWALVLRQILGSLFTVIALWYFSRWRPSLKFSRESFKKLFGYGSKLLMAGIYAKIFQNLNEIIIGRAYDAGSLGFYTQAKKFSNLAAITVSNIFQQVSFPVLSSLQSNREKMISVYRQLIKMSGYVMFFLMATFAVLAEPFIDFFLGEKWAATVPLLQWLCMSYLFYPISALNLNILNANGRSDLFMKIDMIKSPLTIIALIITVPISVEAIVIGRVIVTLINFFINAYMPGKLYGYGALAQFKDLWKMVFATGLTALITVFAITLVDSSILKLMFGIFTSLMIYWGFSVLFKFKELSEFKELIRKMIRK
ncbi:lipopolysaccharide biosynthesis protein [Maribellus mangrovi]|uniref:lipopolysaccharide biosynthesis protein n=1 Tax=Maribellus mangrovi TaxID=3133146 RepID=UPI0030EEE5CA